jgi:hypothetical protein
MSSVYNVSYVIPSFPSLYTTPEHMRSRFRVFEESVPDSVTRFAGNNDIVLTWVVSRGLPFVLNVAKLVVD